MMRRAPKDAPQIVTISDGWMSEPTFPPAMVNPTSTAIMTTRQPPITTIVHLWTTNVAAYHRLACWFRGGGDLIVWREVGVSCADALPAPQRSSPRVTMGQELSTCKWNNTGGNGRSGLPGNTQRTGPAGEMEHS